MKKFSYSQCLHYFSYSAEHSFVLSHPDTMQGPVVLDQDELDRAERETPLEGSGDNSTGV